MTKNIFKITMIMLALIGLSINGFSQINVSWEPIQTYSTTSTSPGYTQVADIDNDGDKDLISSSYTQHKIIIALNDGNSNFDNMSEISTYAYPRGGTIADFNNDGNLDLAYPHSSGTNMGHTVSIHLGNGDGTFLDYVTYSAYGSYTYSLASGDVNEDGFLDLLVASAGWDGFSILVNNGDGTFTLGNNYSAGVEPSKILLGDFDNDDNLDVALTCGAYGGNAVDVFYGVGDATFENRTSFLPPVSQARPWLSSVEDFDADGNLDILVAASVDGSNEKKVYLMKNDGLGNFTYQYISESFPVLYVCDWNNDSHLDFFGNNYNPTTLEYEGGSIFINDGSGNFTEHFIISETRGMVIDKFDDDDYYDLILGDADENYFGVYIQDVPFMIETDGNFVQLNNPVSIPVTATSELTTDDGIYSYQFVYNFDETKLQYVDYELTGTIAEGGTVNVSTSVAGQLTVSCMRATPITGQGDLIYFNFNAITLL